MKYEEQRWTVLIILILWFLHVQFGKTFWSILVILGILLLLVTVLSMIWKAI